MAAKNKLTPKQQAKAAQKKRYNKRCIELFGQYREPGPVTGNIQPVCIKGKEYYMIIMSERFKRWLVKAS